MFVCIDGKFGEAGIVFSLLRISSSFIVNYFRGNMITDGRSLDVDQLFAADISAGVFSLEVLNLLRSRGASSPLR